MSVWIEDRRYDYYGQPLRCLRRWFDGCLEMVDLAFDVPVGCVGREIFTRTARTLAPCVFPRVTTTLGGVTTPAFCAHGGFTALVANAGPNHGLSCCSGCGSRLPEAA